MNEPDHKTSRGRLDPGRLDELIARAGRQADLLEELRVRAAGQVIGLGATAGGL
jgi:hypothetical protein